VLGLLCEPDLEVRVLGVPVGLGDVGVNAAEEAAQVLDLLFIEKEEFGAPETAPPTGQAHPHAGAGFREPKRLRPFGKNNYLSIQSQKTRKLVGNRDFPLRFLKTQIQNV
jgi:hypothetical protein